MGRNPDSTLEVGRRVGVGDIFHLKLTNTLADVFFGVKTCARCGKTKASEDYPPRRDRPSSSAECHTCGRDRYHENLATNRNTARAYYLKNRDAILTESRARYARDPAPQRAATRRWAVNNRAATRRLTREYRLRHPERVKDHSRKRRLAEKNAYVEPVDGIFAGALSDWTCGICGIVVDPTDFHLDHSTPIARGGLHKFDNCLVAHPFCNMVKRDRWSDPWRHPATFLMESVNLDPW